MTETPEEIKSTQPTPHGVTVKRLVKPRDLIFPLENKICCDLGGSFWPPKTSMFQRYLSRKVACSILNEKGGTYQFGGYTGLRRLSYEMVDADRHQLAHWILRRVGYVCCCADLMKLTGTPVV